jgi:hypothetical protein
MAEEPVPKFDALRTACDGSINISVRVAAWKRYETIQWLRAYREGRLNFRQLPYEFQEPVYELICCMERTPEIPKVKEIAPPSLV